MYPPGVPQTTFPPSQWQGDPQPLLRVPEPYPVHSAPGVHVPAGAHVAPAAGDGYGYRGAPGPQERPGAHAPTPTPLYDLLVLEWQAVGRCSPECCRHGAPEAGHDRGRPDFR